MSDFERLYRTVSKIEAAVFDMDGLLIASEPAWKQGREDFFKKFGVQPQTKRENQLLASRIAGRSQLEIAGVYKEKFGLEGSVRQIRQELIDAVKPYYRQVEPIEPAVQVLEVFAGSPLPLALASGAPVELIQVVLERFSWYDCFSAAVSGDEMQASKPDPEIFIKAAMRLGACPRETLVFEDAPNGEKAAHEAGMPCVLVPNKHFDKNEEHTAEFVLESLAELDVERLKNVLSR